MKYYIGHFSGSKMDDKFTVICTCSNSAHASFILDCYRDNVSPKKRNQYVMLTAAEINIMFTTAEIMDLEIVL